MYVKKNSVLIRVSKGRNVQYVAGREIPEQHWSLISPEVQAELIAQGLVGEEQPVEEVAPEADADGTGEDEGSSVQIAGGSQPAGETTGESTRQFIETAKSQKRVDRDPALARMLAEEEGQV